MDEIDLSRPSTELFPEYNSYQDVNVDRVVEDPLGVSVEVANPMTDKEYNFKALREETARLKGESEYWRGQAEAFKGNQNAQPSSQEDAYLALDWDDSSDVKKAFNALREDNQSLRAEVKDKMAALEIKNQHQDWNALVTQHVPELTSRNPIFAEMIKNSSNPYEAAYLLAQLNAGSAVPAQQPTHGNAQRAIDNSQKPRSPSSIGGAGQLSSADYYANMSDEDFMKVAGKNMANI